MQVSQPAPALKAVRTGTIAMLLTDTTKAVAFATAMPSANYTVSFEPDASVAVTFAVGSKTAAGFNVLSIGVAVNLKYRAVED